MIFEFEKAFKVILIVMTLFCIYLNLKNYFVIYDNCTYTIVDESLSGYSCYKFHSDEDFYEYISIPDEATPYRNHKSREDFPSLEEYNEYLQTVTNVLDFPQSGIICEYINIDWDTSGAVVVSDYHYEKVHNSIYGVLYSDKTIRYIKGYLSNEAVNTYENFKASDGSIINFLYDVADNKIFFVREEENREEKTVTLSNAQYYSLLARLMLVKLFNVEEKELPINCTQVRKAFCIKDIYYNNFILYNTLGEKIIKNYEKYWNKCMGIEDFRLKYM